MERAHEVVEGVTSVLDDETAEASYVPVGHGGQGDRVGIAERAGVAGAEEYDVEGIQVGRSHPFVGSSWALQGAASSYSHSSYLAFRS